MPIEEVQAGKKSQWMELEITGNLDGSMYCKHWNMLTLFAFTLTRYHPEPQPQPVEDATSDISLLE